MKTMTRLRISSVVLVLAIALAACQPTSPPGGAGGKLKVVVTFSILGDLVQNVGGDRVELHTLVASGMDTHTFDPRPLDGAALADAAVVFENGLGFEPWFDKLFRASGSGALRVIVTDGILPRTMAAGEHGDAGGGVDPHAWHDVTNAMHMVERIRDGLAQADPANATTYQANAESYLGQLKELDGWIQAQVATLAPERRKLVTTHDTFGYYAARYGFEVVGTALGSLSTEVADPSAGEIAALVQAIRSAGVPAVFAENVANPRLMQQIAAEAGVTLGPALYTDALGQTGTEGDTYIRMERYNTGAIVSALGPTR
jgi:zinc/manganese transport system substrate-binding protein